MSEPRRSTILAVVMTLAFCTASPSRAAEIVRNGQALGAVWHSGDQPDAAKDLAEFIEKMSGATLEVKTTKTGERPAAGQPAIVLGKLARELGLGAPPATVSLDGYRLKSQGNHLLLAGESPLSTRYAVTHFLEHLGCRWFMPNPLGEIVPQRKTIPLDGLDVSEKPDFLYRNVWAFVPNARSRQYGMDLPNRHDWEHVPAAKYFADHPEYFAERGGQRRPSHWVCTSNPDVARLFADAYIAKARQGVKADTISPPDGRGFCECSRCRALDVPGYVEPSSGTLSMSDRYVRFFDAVGRRVAGAAPDFLLSFYCYSDYTLPPKTFDKTSGNLCAWVTTIRFCRLHGVDNPNCESRQRYRKVVEGWSKLMRTACYDYNYNLAEVTVPISKITYMRQNIPFLKKSGCLGINLESMAAWNLYGPHTYLASRLMWHADADADVIMDDYYTKLFAGAARHVKSYWQRIDKAVCMADVHAGGFFAVHAIWTPELVKACEADLDAAHRAAENEPVRQRVALFRSGLESAKHFLDLRSAMNGCDFAAAQATFERWMKHMDDAFDKKFNTMSGYKRGYAGGLQRTIAGGLARTAGPCKLVLQLPDEWDFRYDPENVGESQGYFRPEVPAEGWQKVRTYSATLNEQKVPEQLTWMWYRVKIKVPAVLPSGPLHMWFAEVDGSPAKVFLDGRPVGEFTGSRVPSDVDITGKLLPGRDSVIAVKTGHHGISELMLGGILRPVMIYAGTRPGLPAKAGR
jgi:hypothetical protein